MRVFFSWLANTVTRLVSAAYSSAVALLVILVWIFGLFFVPNHFFNQFYTTLLQVIASIITFLMVFFSYHSLSIDSTATHLKLDHILHIMENADNKYIAIEEKTEPELKELKSEMLEKVNG